MSCWRSPVSHSHGGSSENRESLTGTRKFIVKIKQVTVTPIAFKDPPLLNASGIHEPYALRSIIEVESDSGLVGLGESYGDAPALAVQQSLPDKLVGLDPFNLNGL